MSSNSGHLSCDISLLPFRPEHLEAITSIYNGYVLSGTAAFPQEPVGPGHFDFLMEMPGIYPVYVLQDVKTNQIAGFCFLSPFHPQPTFRKTALIDYFIAPKYTGKGLGTLCLQRLEEDAKKAGISHIVADISTENSGSLSFHQKHGFRHCGTLENIGHKLGRDFGIAHMQKDI